MSSQNIDMLIRLLGKDDGASNVVRKFGKEVEGVKSQLTDFARVAAGALGAGFTAAAFLDANAQVQALNLGFTQVTGSSQAAGEEMAFVRAEANRLGLIVNEAAGSYLNLAASAKGTSLEGEQTREIWSAVANAMANLQKTPAETQGALLAVSQMMSKGTVAAEELRGQLGERLPGAFQVAAKAMGVTTAELGKMLENGQVVAADFLPKFAAELNKSFGSGGEIHTYTANVNRLRNALTDTFVQIGQGGSFEALTKGVKVIADNFDAISQAALTTGAVIGSVWAGRRISKAIDDTTDSINKNIIKVIAAREAAIALAVQEEAAAAAALNQARAQQAAAAATLAEANANRAAVAELAIYGAARAAAERQVAVAATAHIAASQAVIAADARMVAAGTAAAAAQSKTALASRGLSAAVNFLGGGVGAVTALLVLGGIAWTAWGNHAENAIEKSKRKSMELKDQVNAIQDRLNKEANYGQGDLGTMREYLSVLEDRRRVLDESVRVNRSPGAASELAKVDAEIAKTRSGIETLEKAAKSAGDGFTKMTLNGKNIAKEFTTSIGDQIKAYEGLNSAIQTAMASASQSEKDHLARARELRNLANEKPKDTSPEGQSFALLDLLDAKQKLRDMAARPDSSLENIIAQSEAVRKLAGNLDDQAEAASAVRDAYNTEAAAHEKAAAEDKVRQAGLREEWRNTEQIVKDLQAAMDSLGKGTAIKIESAEAKAILDQLRQKLDALQDKTITVRVVPLGTDGKPLDNLAVAAQARAAGGPITGQGTDTSDNILVLGSPNEYMLRAAAVRHYGISTIDAMNSLRLPRFANGGLLNQMPVMPSAQSVSGRSSANFPNFGRIEIGLGGETIPVYATPDVAGQLRDVLSRERLKRGHRP